MGNMTQAQIWIAIAAIASPTVVALMGILLNQHGFNKVDHRLDRLDVQTNKRFDGVNARFEAVTSTVNSRFEGVNERFEAMNAKFDSRFDAFNAKLDSKFDGLNARLDSMNSTLVGLIIHHSERISRIEERTK